MSTTESKSVLPLSGVEGFQKAIEYCLVDLEQNGPSHQIISASLSKALSITEKKTDVVVTALQKHGYLDDNGLATPLLWDTMHRQRSDAASLPTLKELESFPNPKDFGIYGAEQHLIAGEKIVTVEKHEFVSAHSSAMTLAVRTTLCPSSPSQSNVL